MIITSAFAKQTCISNSFSELEDLMALAAPPTCSNNQIPQGPIAEGIKIDVNPYASGMYFLEVRDSDNNL